MSQPERPTCKTCYFVHFLPGIDPWKSTLGVSAECHKSPPAAGYGFARILTDAWCAAHQDYPAYVAAMKANQADG